MSGDDNFIYRGFIYIGGGSSMELGTVIYNGRTIDYFYNKTPQEIYSIVLSVDNESRYIIPPKGGTVISLQYPSFISEMPQFFLHVKLSNNEVKFLEDVAKTTGLGNNLYVHEETYQQTLQLIKIISDSQADGDGISAGQFIYGYGAAMGAGVVEILLDGFNVDALPEKLYPVSDRRSVERLSQDIKTSKVVNALMLTSVNQYMELAGLDNQSKTRRIQRLNNNLNGGNKSLFKKVFASDAKSFSIKGFVVE
jgi:hypothetical protein